MMTRDLPISFHRTNHQPLDYNELFQSTKDLFDYIENGPVYVGQRVVLFYNDFEQIIEMRQGPNNLIVPVIVNPAGIETIFNTTKKENDVYALVYYYAGGKAFTDKIVDATRLTDPWAWSMLPQANLLAFSNDTINYCLDVDGESHFFSQLNFALDGNDTDLDFIKSSGNDNGFYATDLDGIYILTRKQSNDHIIKLWVECNEYYQAIGV